VRTSDPEALEEIREIVRKLDVPSALVLLEVRIMQVDLLDGMNSFFEYQAGYENFGLDFATGDIANASGGGVAGSGLRMGDMIFQFVDQNFAARMQVLERENRLRSLATPILLTANNEVSRLFVGREVPLNRSFTGGQVVANQTTTTTATGSTAIEFRPVGTTLLITPNINADRTVTLRIVQETSDVNSTASVLVPTIAGFAPQTVPVVSSQTVSGTIVAKSDLAVAFGGLIEQGVRKEKSQVPFLGDIPLVGVLFQRTDDADTRREIVVVVRPYVLSTPAEAEGASTRLFQALDVDPMRSAHQIVTDQETAEKKPKHSVPESTRVHGLGDEDGPR
jgi:general secretion pathway protein D